MPFVNLAAAAALAASAAAAPPVSADQSAAPSIVLPAPVSAPLDVAPPPTFTVGEEWEFDSVDLLDGKKEAPYTQRVSGVSPSGASVNYSGSRSGSAALDANANYVHSRSSSYEPSDQKLQFPLSIGKKWSASYVYTNGSWRTKCEREAEVVAIERVETPAGTFETFRIEEKTLWQSNDLYGGTGITRETLWYSPQAGRLIKGEFQDHPVKGAGAAGRWQLTRFSPAPSTAR